MSNDLDLLMSRMEEINAKAATDLTPEDIDTVIEYHRRQRARKAAGEKAPSAKPSVDLSSIMNKLTAKTTPSETIKRRI